jgi:hypothetical protein
MANQTVPLEMGEMPADGVVRQSQFRGQFVDRAAAAAEQGNDPAAGAGKETLISIWEVRRAAGHAGHNSLPER